MIEPGNWYRFKARDLGFEEDPIAAMIDGRLVLVLAEHCDSPGIYEVKTDTVLRTVAVWEDELEEAQ